MDQSPDPVPSSPTRPSVNDPWDEEELTELKTALTRCDGEATLTELTNYGFVDSEKWRKRFGRSYISGLPHLRHSGFNSTCTAVFHNGEWTFRLRERKRVSTSSRVVFSAAVEQEPRRMSLVERGVDQLKSVLTELGGSAPLDVLERKYQQRYVLTFQESCRQYFQIYAINDLRLHPEFKSSFFMSNDAMGLEIGLKGTGSAPSDAPEGLESPVTGEGIQKIVTAGAARKPLSLPEKAVEQLVEANSPPSDGAEWMDHSPDPVPSSPTRPSDNGLQDKQRHGLPDASEWAVTADPIAVFGEETEEIVTLTVRVVQKILASQKKPAPQKNNKKKKKEAKKQIVAPKEKKNTPQKQTRYNPPELGVERLKTVLLSLGGSADLQQLETEYKKRFRKSFSGSWNTYFGAKKLKEVCNHSAFRSEFTCFREGDDWIFGLKPIPSAQPGAPSRAEMEARGVQQLKTALAACGGSATTEEWLEKFEDIFGVAPIGSWVDEHFGADRPSGLVDLPVFQDTFIENETEPGVWVYEERSPPSLEAQKAVAQLLEILETCGGSAEFDDLQDMYAERFGGELDEEWMKENFGCENLADLLELPIVRSEVVLGISEHGTWLCSRIVNGKATRQSGTVATEGGDEDEPALLAQFVRILIDVGGVATFTALKDALEKQQRLKVVVTRGRLQRMADFDEEMELLNGRRLCLRRQEHWNEVKENFLTVLDYCNGHCTTASFPHAYYHQFGVDLEMKNIDEMISRLSPGFITISERGGDDGETFSIVNGPGKAMHAGRRRIYQVLKKAGGRATIGEMMQSYELTHQTDVSTVCWFYFGTEDEEELLPMLNDHKMFVLETERGKELFLKPECRGFFRDINNAAFGRNASPPKISDEEMFSHQCIYVADRIETTINRLGGDARTRLECSEAIKNHKYFNTAFASFVIDCPLLLFQYMIRSKAFMKGELIFLNPEHPAEGFSR